VVAERAYAAACLKHNGLSEECVDFSRSLEIMRLILSCQTSRRRCMFNVLTPEWFKKTVRSTFQ
jgi:hypothetical protein